MRLLRIGLVVLLFVLAVFFAFEAIASFEPGTPLLWRIAYPVLWLLCVALLLRVTLWRDSTDAAGGRLFAFTSALSLLLLVGAVCVWVRSVFASDMFQSTSSPTSAFGVGWSGGRLILIMSARQISIPLWLVAVLTAILPAAWLLTRRRSVPQNRI